MIEQLISPEQIKQAVDSINSQMYEKHPNYQISLRTIRTEQRGNEFVITCHGEHHMSNAYDLGILLFDDSLCISFNNFPESGSSQVRFWRRIDGDC